MTNTKSVSPSCAMSSGVSMSVGTDRLSGTPVGGQRAAVFANVRLVLLPEMLERRRHGCDRGVAERAERFPRDVRRDAGQEIEIARLPLAPFDLPENLVQPVGPFAARRALAARLVAIEVKQVLGEPHHAGGVVQHDDPCGSEERAGLLDAVEAGRRVEL